jgi:hypothetical protein
MLLLLPEDEPNPAVEELELFLSNPYVLVLLFMLLVVLVFIAGLSRGEDDE